MTRVAVGARVWALVLTQHKDQLRDVRVLVVDDDEAVHHGTLHLLRDWGCVAEAAEFAGPADYGRHRARPIARGAQQQHSFTP